MEKIIQAIKSQIKECKVERSIFSMPSLTGCTVNKKELPSGGATLYHCEYAVTLPGEMWVRIDYQSKDKSKTFSNVPDVSVIRVTCSNHNLDFSDSWEER